jgi:hypothetical protein
MENTGSGGTFLQTSQEKQEDHKFKASLGYKAQLSLKKAKGWGYNSVAEHLTSKCKAWAPSLALPEECGK